MAKSADPSAQFVARISFVGRAEGLVKNLAGFKKKHHTVPDAVNAATSAFLGKLCLNELTVEAELLFQRTKVALNYKRADLTLAITSPTAVLSAKDFTWELTYALEAESPASYCLTRTLHSLASSHFVELAEFNEVFAGMFGGILFTLTKNVSVEAVIDAVEACAGEGGLTVHYPSDCRHCVLSVEQVAAEVICDGATLELRFSRSGAPAELVTAFLAVRAAFALTKNRVLAGLL